MPTVYMPLGSEAVFGQVGEMVVYQGTYVRRYVIPRDPRTDQQLDQRHFFADINKMTKQMGLWMRNAARSALGSRWHATLFQMIKLDVSGTWADADARWVTYDQPTQDAWNEGAPWLATWNEPGRIFHNVYVFTGWAIEQGFGGVVLGIGWDDPQLIEAQTWFAKTLEDVLASGKHDQEGLSIDWTNKFSLVSDVGAYLDAYRENPGDVHGFYQFFFYGSRVVLFGRQGVGGGTAQITIDGGTPAVVDFTALSDVFGPVYYGDYLTKGLHYVHFLTNENGFVNLDAVEITGSKPPAPRGTPVNAAKHHNLAELGDDDHPQYLTSGRADLLYSLLGHDHDALYSLLAHAHDDLYAALSHDHDSDYSALGHTHDDLYAALSHNHDSAYLAKDAAGHVSIGSTQTIADDAAYSFTPPTAAAMILIQSRSAATTNYLWAFYVTSAGGGFSPVYAVGTNTNTTTGALTGTTGTNGKLTCSVNTSNGKIYIENRTGQSRNIVIKIW